MTSRTRTPIICECGHTGFVMMKENDAPFTRMYEEYSLEGFNGDSYTIYGFDPSGNTLEKLKPSCPKCLQTGKVRYDRQ